MSFWKSSLPFLICLLLLMGCSMGTDRAHRESMQFSVADQSASSPSRSPGEAGADSETRRFIAVRHSVVVETPETELQKAWESVAEFCRTDRCEIISSKMRQGTNDSQPFAALLVRVAPEEVKALFEYLGKVGKITELTTQSEDKTGTVIDVEAKLKNLTELRDRLRNLLASPNGSLKDIIEVERELSRVQSELDSFQAKRKVLANETEKVSIDISFHARKSFAGAGTFAPIASAWHESGRVLAESIAFAITFVVAVIPWLVLMIPIVWLMIRVFRRLRGKAAVPKKTIPVEQCET